LNGYRPSSFWWSEEWGQFVIDPGFFTRLVYKGVIQSARSAAAAVIRDCPA